MALFSWRDWISTIATGSHSNKVSRRKRPLKKFGVEALESRTLLSATAMVKDIDSTSDESGIYPSYSYYNNSPTNVNGVVFFMADDGIHGQELWKSDGTSNGTVMVADLTPGPDYSYLYEFTAVGNTLFFLFDDGVHGVELWSSDGTAAGTAMVADIAPGEEDSIDPYYASLTDVNGTLFFLANDVVHGQELWKSDGTAAGTVMVVDLTPGEYSPGYGKDSYLYDLTAVGGTLYFVFDDGVNGSELWKSDGTALGTSMVLDINLDGDGVYASDYEYSNGPINVAGTLFFIANDGVNGQELWKTDGTAAGTVMVADLTPGEDYSYFYDLVVVDS